MPLFSSYPINFAAGASLTVNNIITLAAGADSQTFTFPSASDTVAGLGAAQTFSAANIFSVAGAASVPAIKVSGTPFAGTGTTSFPQVYIQDSAATASTTLSTAGTSLGVNAHTGIGNLLAGYLDGVEKFKFISSGSLVSGGSLTAAGSVTVGGGSALTWSGRGILTSSTTGRVQLGDVDAASPVAQTLATQSVIAGTSNTAGVSRTEVASLSTGSGTNGDYIIQTGFGGISATSTVTISNASPAVISWTAHGLSVGQPLRFTTTGTLPTGLALLTTYYVISAGFGANAFEVSATPGGSAINTSSAGSGTQTASTALAQNQGVTAVTIKGGTQQAIFAVPFQVAGDTTGAGTTVGFGTNSPAITVSAPYTWIKMISSDGSTVYTPAYK